MAGQPKSSETSKAEDIPNAEEFRAWLKTVLIVLGYSAHRLAIACEAPTNSVKKFLSRKQEDLRLNTASRLVRGARKIAEEQGVELPRLVSVENDGDSTK